MCMDFPIGSMKDAIQVFIDAKSEYEAEEVIYVVLKEAFPNLKYVSAQFGGDGGKDAYDVENKNVYHIYSPIIEKKNEALHVKLHAKFKSDLEKVFKGLNEKSKNYPECNKSIHIMSIKTRGLPKDLENEANDTHIKLEEKYENVLKFKSDVITFRDYFKEISYLLNREKYDNIVREFRLETLASIFTNSLEADKIYEFLKKFSDIKEVKDISINNFDDWERGISVDEKIELNKLLEFKREIENFVRDDLGNFEKVYGLMLQDPSKMLLFQKIRIYIKEVYRKSSNEKKGIDLYDEMIQDIKKLNNDFIDSDREIENLLHYLFVYCDIFEK